MSDLRNLMLEVRHHTLVSESEHPADVVETLHAHLDCIDSKTAALLSYDAILVAVLTILSSSTNLSKALPHAPLWQLPLVGSAALTVLSAAICLFGLDIIGAHSRRDATISEYILYTARVSIGRTSRYRAALLMTLVSSAVIMVAFLFCLAATLR